MEFPMATCLLLLVFATTLAAAPDRGDIVELGGDPSHGILYNATPGARPFDPPDPALPSLVIVHGLNLMPRTSHLPMARRLGEAIARRGGPRLNVLGWDWNADTLVGLSPRANHEHAVEHGRRLSCTLLVHRLAPARIHLIGQSSGAIVVASAARALCEATGEHVAQATLLDPATFYHDLVFRRLAIGSCCVTVEHYWASGPTGFSRQVSEPGIRDLRVNVPGTWRGMVAPNQSAHMNVARWYIETVAQPERSDGFNASVFSRGG
jgi:hypothetical protein